MFLWMSDICKTLFIQCREIYGQIAQSFEFETDLVQKARSETFDRAVHC